MSELFPYPYLGAPVELTDKRAEHIARQHPDLLPAQLDLVAGTLARHPHTLFAGSTPVVAVLLFLVAGIIAVRAYWPRPFDGPPNPATLRAQYLTTDPRIAKLEVVDTIIQAYHKNEQVLGRKIRAFKWGFALTALASAMLGAAVIVQVAFQTIPWSP